MTSVLYVFDGPNQQRLLSSKHLLPGNTRSSKRFRNKPNTISGHSNSSSKNKYTRFYFRKMMSLANMSFVNTGKRQDRFKMKLFDELRFRLPKTSRFKTKRLLRDLCLTGLNDTPGLINIPNHWWLGTQDLSIVTEDIGNNDIATDYATQMHKLNNDSLKTIHNGASRFKERLLKRQP